MAENTPGGRHVELDKKVEQPVDDYFALAFINLAQFFRPDNIHRSPAQLEIQPDGKYSPVKLLAFRHIKRLFGLYGPHQEHVGKMFEYRQVDGPDVYLFPNFEERRHDRGNDALYPDHRTAINTVHTYIPKTRLAEFPRH